MKQWPDHPVVHEIFTWVWLADLSRDLGRTVTLAEIPAAVWDDVARAGIDAVWLMGVWERSPQGAEIARANPAMRAAHVDALDDFTDGDVVGSAYCIRNYVVDDFLGGNAGLAVARDELAARGVRLILDFVPNHVAPDHPWVTQHPHYFIQATPDDLERDPASFIRVGDSVLACGRDPYFPAWPEVVQLDASNASLRAAMAELAVELAGICDGVRCDMAMLVLDDVFEQTWGRRAPAVAEDSDQPVGYWPTVIKAVRAVRPDFVFWAEAYWDLEPVLLDQGFDACYDKRLYDRMIHERSVSGIRAHLSADIAFQRRTVRFLENHDEPRVASLVGIDVQLASLVAVATLPGIFLVHEGQAEGRQVRVPVTLGRRPAEAIDTDLRAATNRVLAAVAGGIRIGEWQLAPVWGWPDNQSAEQLLAWTWTGPHHRHLVVVNLSDGRADGRVQLPWTDLGDATVLVDALSGDRFERQGIELMTDGLYVALDAASAHVLRLVDE